MYDSYNEKIDFVITWVDGSDPVWLEEKKRYQIENEGDHRPERYRNWDNLRYWFRGVEKFAPWVNKIHFVTYGHIPPWLNVEHPKLHIVKHEEYIPKEYLPTFSCRAIELNLHRIEGLTEQFVYFNDDMFLLAPVMPVDFFVNGFPCETAVLNVLSFGFEAKNRQEKMTLDTQHFVRAFDMLLINRYFDKNQSIRQNWRKWFTLKYGLGWLRTLWLMPWKLFVGFKGYHLPYSYLKSTFEEVWEKEPEFIEQTCVHKFRKITDINQWVIDYWQMAKGTFWPRNPKIGKYYEISDDEQKNHELYKVILDQRKKMICINDKVKSGDFETLREQLNNCFERVFPDRCGFERDM